jgi:hypothetical protein
MFIVNQSETLIQNMNRVGFVEVRGCQIVTECGTIATYKTEDRAKEVLKEMVDALTPAFVMENVELPENIIKDMAHSNFLIVKDDVSIEQINPFYKMPKD